MEASPPPGMWAATGSVTAKAPTLADIRHGSFSESGWKEEPQRLKGSLRRSGSNLQELSAQNEGASGPPKTMSSSDKLRSQGAQQSVEPFPAVAEEDAHTHAPQEKDSGHDILQAPSYEEATKEDLKDGSKVSEHGNSGSEGHSKESPHHVRQVSSIADTDLTSAIVRQRLRASAKAPVDDLDRHRSESLLEVVPDHPGLPHHAVRPERGGLGRHVIPTTLQRRTRHVYPYVR